MQLNAKYPGRLWRCAAGLVVLMLSLTTLLAKRVQAQSRVEIGNTTFYEWGGPLNMTVHNPVAKASADVVDPVSIQASWEADVVSGASVAVVDAPGGASVDAVTSATTLYDFRQVVRGGAALTGDTTRLSGSYGYGFENDYRSHGLVLNAATELFDRNTTLELSYGRGWDSVCDLNQPDAEKAIEKQRMPDSSGCFERGEGRIRRSLDLHNLQGAWTQAWTPIFNTQLVLATQLSHGFQSNPYRAVWLGKAAAQEHHPDDRARYTLGLSARLWVKPTGGAFQLTGRVYRDTWDLTATSAELAYERGLGQMLRVRARGRYYHQGQAAFYSDDYVLNPRGEYFTGDRELSPMDNWLVGARLELSPLRGESGKMLRIFESFRFVLKGDYVRFDFRDFHYGTAAIPNNQAVFGSLALDATF